MTKHTPTPWTISEKQGSRWKVGLLGADLRNVLTETSFPHAKANAQFIIKAVNSHDELVEALKNILNCEYAHLIPSNIFDPAKQILADCEVTND